MGTGAWVLNVTRPLVVLAGLAFASGSFASPSPAYVRLSVEYEADAAYETWEGSGGHTLSMGAATATFLSTPLPTLITKVSGQTMPVVNGSATASGYVRYFVTIEGPSGGGVPASLVPLSFSALIQGSTVATGHPINYSAEIKLDSSVSGASPGTYSQPWQEIGIICSSGQIGPNTNFCTARSPIGNLPVSVDTSGPCIGLPCNSSWASMSGTLQTLVGVEFSVVMASSATSSSYARAEARVDPYLYIDPEWVSTHPGYSISISNMPVPEPTSTALMIAGLAAVLAAVRRRLQT